MLNNNDIRGRTAYANMTLLPSKSYIPKPLSKYRPNIIEMPKTPFTGLSKDMRGRDDLGYAICKSYTIKQKAPDESKRLVNPNKLLQKEQYPQPKKRVFSSSLNIKPSEIDLLTKIKDDNTKMLILQ